MEIISYRISEENGRIILYEMRYPADEILVSFTEFLDGASETKIGEFDDRADAEVYVRLISD